MRSAIFVSCALALSVAAGLGCSSGRDEATGDSAALTDEELALAKSAVAIVAGADGHCNKCHTASRNDILRWGQSMIQVELDCFRSELTPEGRVSCLSSNPSDPEARFTASRLGFYSAATKYNAFRELFTQAGQSERFDALQSAAMPSSDFVPAISEQDFLTIQRWVFGGMRGLDEATAQPISESAPTRFRRTSSLT